MTAAPRSPRELWHVSVTDFPRGMGSTVRVRSICHALSVGGYRSRLLIPHALGHGRNDRVAGTEDGIPFEYVNGSTTRPSNPLKVALAKVRGNLRLLVRLLRSGNRPACIFVYNATLLDCWGVLIARRLRRVPVVLDLSDEWYDPSTPISSLGLARYVFKRVAKGTEGFLYRHVDRIVVVSSHLERRLGAHPGKVLRCPMAFDPGTFAAAEPERLASGDEFAVLYAGSVSLTEGVAMLLDAVRTVAGTLSGSVRLFVVGSPAHNETVAQYEAAAGELAAHGVVSFLPAVDRRRYASLLRGADLLVIPRPTSVSSSAGFPYKLAEYISSGVPVLVTRFGDVEEYFSDGVHCLMCDPSAAGLADGIRRGMALAGAASDMGTAGRRRAEELFGFGPVADRLRRLLEGMGVSAR